MPDARKNFSTELQTGSFAEGLDKMRKFPRELQELIASAKCHLNLNQIYDYYQRFGASETYKAVENDINTAMRSRQQIDHRLSFQCGHMHRTYQEAQTCPTYLAMLRGEQIKTYHHS